MTGPAEISEKLAAKLQRLSRDIYRLLGLSGYARLDFRVTADENAYLLEANPNPQIASDEDFASAAEAAGIEYPELIEQLIRFGMSYDPERMIM
jgi:D-alanine-D-alanine ligase